MAFWVRFALYLVRVLDFFFMEILLLAKLVPIRECSSSTTHEFVIEYIQIIEADSGMFSRPL